MTWETILIHMVHLRSTLMRQPRQVLWQRLVRLSIGSTVMEKTLQRPNSKQNLKSSGQLESQSSKDTSTTVNSQYTSHKLRIFLKRLLKKQAPLSISLKSKRISSTRKSKQQKNFLQRLRPTVQRNNYMKTQISTLNKSSALCPYSRVNVTQSSPT